MAARKIAVQYGLINIPARTESATTSRESLTNLCVGQPGHEAHDASPLKRPSKCEVCGPIEDTSALVKGRQDGDTYAIVTQEDVAEAKESYAKDYLKRIELVTHPAEEFLAATGPGDTIAYLTPEDAAGADHYQLLVRLIESHPELVFVGLHTPMSATSLYMVTVRDGVLVMSKRTRQQAMKAAPSVGGTVNEALYAMLEGALDSFVVPYDPAAYEDHYDVALRKMLDEADTVAASTTEATTPVATLSDDDIMAKLAKLKKVS